MPQDQTAGAGRLVAVVVTHDRLEQLRRTLARLLESPPQTLHAVVVVDNASTDGTRDWLAALDEPRLDVLRTGRNIGGAGGFEAGMRRAAERFDPDWIVVMDDDARPDPGALAAFHRLAPWPAEAVAAAVRFPAGGICDINRPSRNPFWHPRAFLRTALGGGRDGFHLSPAAYDAGQPCPIDAASFVGLFVSRRGLALAGFPDGRLFIYADDVLYTLGLRQAGGRILFDPRVRFVHDFATLAPGARRFRPLWKGYYYHRNLTLAYRRAAGPFFWPAMLMIVPKWLWAARAHSGQRRAYLRLLLLALRHGLTGRLPQDHARILRLSGETAPEGTPERTPGPAPEPKPDPEPEPVPERDRGPVSR